MSEPKIGIFTEADLAPLVVQFLEQQENEIFQEVRMGGMGSPIVDIIGMKGPLLHGIELKKNLSMTVIRQAVRNRRYVHCSSVAISARRHPVFNHVIRSDDREFAIQVCRDYKVGVFEVFMQDDNIDQVVPPVIQRGHHKYIKKTILPLITDNHRLTSNYSNAGTKGGGYFTPYKEMIEIVKKYIEAHPGCEIGQIISHLIEEHHQSRLTTIPRKATLMANLKKIESNWCIVKQPRGQRTNAYFHR